MLAQDWCFYAYEKLAQFWVKVSPLSSTLAQHKPMIGPCSPPATNTKFRLSMKYYKVIHHFYLMMYLASVFIVCVVVDKKFP